MLLEPNKESVSTTRNPAQRCNEIWPHAGILFAEQIGGLEGMHVCWLLRLLLCFGEKAEEPWLPEGWLRVQGQEKKYVPLDNMQPRCGLYHLRDFTRLQRKRSLLEFLLHVTFPEKSPASHKWSAAVFPGTVETGLFFF